MDGNMIRRFVEVGLSRNPGLDGLFRRHVWSRLHFPEAELRALDRLAACSMSVAVDVGCALGSYSWVLARKARRVVAYEPGEQNAAYLEAALKGTNVTLVQAAVGAQAGALTLYTEGDNKSSRFTATLSGNNPVVRSANVRARTVPVVTLDTDLLARLLDRDVVDLIKIDVEGFENSVLQGAAATLARDHPLVLCEIETRHNPNSADAFDYLRGAGYVVHFRKFGAWHLLQGNDISGLQQPADLEGRLHGMGEIHNRYINNFVFQHPLSRVKLC